MPNDSTDPVAALLRVLDMERPADNIFHAQVDQREGRLFGGLVLAQAVTAAGRTVAEGTIHSFHAYFLRPGKPVHPIDYHVERVRDGRTFTTRRISAIQAGDMIFEATVSFARPEPGISYQQPMPDAPDPDGLPTWWESVASQRPEEAAHHRHHRDWPRPVELYTAAPAAQGELPTRSVWAKTTSPLPEDPLIHAAAMAYLSDSGLIATVATRFGSWGPGGASASLDHAMWFHHAPKFDGWLLFNSESPTAHNARALIFGSIWSPDGTRMASVAQEGLVRTPRKG
ncbi:MAG TPA: acyl-CoA thioesterase domain-containing protein [Tepidiformaceae bacterium]|nr:acyl-CoA thioesterase domain-containing protein [Tepidiformaceae bacterium]